jgi:phenylpropionate dioxygenase-like ring-hydroxylating dioxygenase large terminal subunit
VITTALSPDVAERRVQIRRALSRVWFPVALESELFRHPVGARLLDVPLVVYRGQDDGEIRVADNRCPHRGAALDDGEVVGNSVRCPYHGWEWDGGTGGCTRVPALADQGQIPPSARLRTYPVQVKWGFVWTVLSDDPVADLPEPAWLDYDYVYATRKSHTSANLLHVQENFRDVAHFAFVHPFTIPVGTTVVPKLTTERAGWDLHMEWIVEPGATSAPHRLKDDPHPAKYHAVVPGLVSYRGEYGETGKTFVIHVPCPVSLDEVEIFWMRGIDVANRELLNQLVRNDEEALQEDRAIVSRVEPDTLGASLDHQVHTIADAYTLMYRRAFDEFVDEFGADVSAASNGHAAGAGQAAR